MKDYTEEITLTDYEKDELLNVSDSALETIVTIVKDLTLEMPLYEIDANTIASIIEENWG